MERTRALYSSLGYPVYRWVENPDPPAWSPLRQPLSSSRLGLVASGGIYRRGQLAFHYADDASFRAVPTDVPTSELRATHFAYDLTDARRDINCVFPIDPLRTLRDNGTIGSLANEAYTFMGGIYSSRRVRDELAPAIVDRLVEQHVDALLLVPV